MVSLRRRRLLGLCSGKRNSFQYLEISFRDVKLAERFYAKKTRMSFFLHLTWHICYHAFVGKVYQRRRPAAGAKKTPAMDKEAGK